MNFYGFQQRMAEVPEREAVATERPQPILCPLPLSYSSPPPSRLLHSGRRHGSASRTTG